MTAAAAIATASFHSSCLLGRQVDFNEGGLPPLTPPSVLEESVPRPNSMVLVDAEPGTQAAEVGFTINVIEPNPYEAVVGRWFVNRVRPCLTGMNCGARFRENLVPAGDASDRRFIRTISLPVSDSCQWVDLYVSSDFVDSTEDPESDRTPSRRGDRTHVRWFFFVRPSGSTVPADWSQCPQSPPGGGAEFAPGAK